MNFTVGQDIEAVHQFGVWHLAEIVYKRERSVVVTFPPWNTRWNREIFDPSEVRERSDEVLVPRRFSNKKSPNLKKLEAGDIVYLAGEEVKVRWSDPIRKSVTVNLSDSSIRTVNAWELEECQVISEPRKKRKTAVQAGHAFQPIAAAETVKTNPSITESKNLEFCFHVLPSGTVVRVGSFYKLSFAAGSVFVCTQISKMATEFTYLFVLGTLLNDKVNSLSQGVSCTVKDSEQISFSNVACNSLVRTLVDNIISKSWERILNCQEGNAGNVSYLLELRKSCSASQIRQGVWSGISRSATRPAQPIHLGVFDPLLDTQIFGLSSKNHFQVVYKGKDISKLDSLLGAQWDVKVLEPLNPHSHFKYVCQVRLYIHKLSFRFNFAYSESNVPFTSAYRTVCVY